MSLVGLIARVTIDGARTRRRAHALMQCRRLRQELHGAVAALQRNEERLGMELLILEAALRDIANAEECTTFYACQRRARQVLERAR